MSAGLLIVNADDFGLTPGVNRGIVEGFERGIVTSTSMLAVAPAFDDAVSCRKATDHERLGIGVHFALVGEDPPLLPAKEIPSLVDSRGRFWASWKQFLPRAVAGRIDPGEVRAELRAQLQRIEEAGITPTHVDTHQHLHLWPVVRGVVLDLARDAGIDAIRVPRSTGRGLQPRGIGFLAGRLSAAARVAGLRHPQGFAGLDESGHLDRERLATVVDSLVAGRSVEIGCHPGVADDPARDRYRWGFEWPAELAALCDPAVRERIERRGFVLGSFADL
jgi:predicted glycoside hydrolase/deacetylase ChbG (UPF0249 family)